MECASKDQFGLFGSMYFLGFMLSALTSVRIADRIGRKRVAFASNLLHSAFVFLMLLSKSYKMGLIANFFIGYARGGQLLSGFAWMSDSMRVPDVAKMTAVLFGVDSLAIFWASIYFRFISKNWKIIYVIPFLLHIVLNIILFCKKEGPKYYYGKEDYETSR